MTTQTASRLISLSELRQEFDNAYAVRPAGPTEELESLITLRVASESLAVRTRHITGIVRRNRILSIPTRVPWLLGIVAIRDVLLPVYNLAALLGLPAGAGESSWLLLACPETPIALTFDEFEGQAEITRSCLYENDSSGSHHHLRTMARLDGASRAVIDIQGIVEEIRRTGVVLEPAKE